jgi:hypothetical protein
MTNFIIPDVEGLGVVNSVQDSNGLNNNFKTIQLSKSYQEPHLKDLSMNPRQRKNLDMRLTWGPKK